MNDELFYDARVRIIRQSKYKTTKLLGKIGIVRSTYPGSGSIPVEFDDEFNIASSRGYFYFKRNEVELVESDNEEDTNMSKDKITNYLNTANVRFVNSIDSGVHSFANFDETLTEGDLCAVVTEKGDFRLAKVFEIINDNDKETYREVIAKINTEAYDERVGRREKAAELKAKMEERAKQLQDIALYQLLAKDDSAMMELLNEYQSLNKV